MSAPTELKPLSHIRRAHPALSAITLRTLSRWVTRGAHGIKLQSRRIGGRTMTSIFWVNQFLAACDKSAGATEPQPRSPHERNRASEDAAAELAKVGA